MPSYKLRYFNYTGRGEPIRMILNYGGIPFEDERFSDADWPKIKPTTPIGQVPVLEIDGTPYMQTTAICRHLSSTVGLSGKDAQENFQIDIVVETIVDLLSTAYDIAWGVDPAAKSKAKEKTQVQLPVVMGFLEESAKKNSGFLASSQVSWADILFLTGYEDLVNMLGGKEVLTDEYPTLQKLKKHLLSIKSFREWIQKRPVLPFSLPYDLKKDL